MDPSLLFSTTYSRMLARELQLDAAGQEQLVEGTSLSRDRLFRLDEYVTLPDQHRIIRNALALSGNPALGLQMGTNLHLAAHGPVGVAAYSSPTLGDAFDTFVRWHNIRAQFVRLAATRQDGELHVRVEPRVPLDEVGLFLIEAMVATMQSSTEFMLGRKLGEAHIALGYPAPAHADSYSAYLHSPYRFDAPATVLRVPLAVVDTPSPFADPIARQQAEAQCEQVARALDQGGAWAQRVTAVLRQNTGQLWTLEQVAANLHLSGRTLIRRLREEGTSYQALLDDELKRQARLHLENPRLTVEAIAATLGYQDVSSFRRAFRRWFGVPPSALQRRKD